VGDAGGAGWLGMRGGAVWVGDAEDARCDADAGTGADGGTHVNACGAGGVEA